MLEFLRKIVRKRKSINQLEKEEDNYLRREFPTIIHSDYLYFNERLEREKTPQIAIQIHMYFVELLEEMALAVNNIIYPFDCYITTDTEEKAVMIRKDFFPICNAKNVYIDVIENRGRDVAPFFVQMSPVVNKYKYIGHIHTKRSLHTDFGDDWRKFLINNLLGTKEYVTGIFKLFEEDVKLGFVMPDVYPVNKNYLKWDGAKESIDMMLTEMGDTVNLPDEPVFPTGNMFWARSSAISIILKQGYSLEDFPDEKGQLNLTLAHSIERIWLYLMKSQGYKYRICVNIDCSEGRKEDKRLIIYNGSGVNEELEKYGEIYIGDRKKLSYDYIMRFEQIVFVDDSCMGPIGSLNHIFETMSLKKVDMWSLLNNPPFFFVLNSSCFQKKEFDRYWKTAQKYDFEKAISYLYNELRKIECSYEVWVHESEYMDKWVNIANSQVRLPYEFMILGCPFVKKDSLSFLENRENERIFSCLKQLPEGERILALYEENN